jgi:hypothetical protein
VQFYDTTTRWQILPKHYPNSEERDLLGHLVPIDSVCHPIRNYRVKKKITAVLMTETPELYFEDTVIDVLSVNTLASTLRDEDS